MGDIISEQWAASSRNRGRLPSGISSYLMRPVGGALIGHIGDRFGQRMALTLSVAAMAISTVLVGLRPGYETIGLATPVALTLLLMVQGLSVGDEYTSSMIFLVEHAPESRRGLMGSLAPCGSSAGILLGSAVGAGFAAAMPTESLNVWGWRIPFLLGLVVGIAGYVLRRQVPETALADSRQRAPHRGNFIPRHLADGGNSPRAVCKLGRYGVLTTTAHAASGTHCLTVRRCRLA